MIRNGSMTADLRSPPGAMVPGVTAIPEAAGVDNLLEGAMIAIPVAPQVGNRLADLEDPEGVTLVVETVLSPLKPG